MRIVLSVFRQNTGRKHVLVKPYILGESTERLRSSALSRDLFREKQEIFHFLCFLQFGTLELCAGSRHDAQPPEYWYAQRESTGGKAHFMPSSNSCFGRQEDILNIVEFGRRNTTSILNMYVWSRQEGKVGLIVGFHSRVENGKWFSGMCFLSFWRKQTTSTDCLHHF